jgi:hypothetical protein
MRRIALTLILLTAVVGAAEARELTWFYVVPAAANTPGNNNTDWHTDLTVYNPHDYTLPIVLEFLETGRDNSGGVPTIEVDVFPWETLTYWDVLGADGFAARGKTGSLLVYGDDLQMSCADHACDLAVFTRTYTLNPSGGAGEFGQAIPGFPTDLGLDGSVIAFMPQVMDDQDFRTNVGVISLSMDVVTVRFELQDPDGNVISQRDETLLPFEHSQWRLERGVTGGSIAAFTTQGPLNAMVVPYASVVNNVTGDAVYVEAHMTAVGLSAQSARTASPLVLPDRVLVPGLVPERRPRQTTE